MAESTLAIAYTELRQEIGHFLGFGRDSSAWSTSQTDDIAQAFKRGLRLFYYHPLLPNQPARHSWRFLKPETTLYVFGSFAASSSRIVDTSSNTITADTGTTFYQTMIGKTITVNSVDYTITAVGATTLTVTPDPGVQSNQQWSMTSDGSFQLPDGFGGLVGPMTFVSTTQYGPLPVVDPYSIRERQQHDSSTGRPQRVALVPGTTVSASAGQRWNLLTDPIPDAVYQLRYRYRVIPDNITSVLAYALGGTMHAGTILEACLAEAELMKHEAYGAHYQAFLIKLASSIDTDCAAHSADTLGYNGGNDIPNRYMAQEFDLTVSGVTL